MVRHQVAIFSHRVPPHSVPRCLPESLHTLSLAENEVSDLNEVLHNTYNCVWYTKVVYS